MFLRSVQRLKDMMWIREMRDVTYLYTCLHFSSSTAIVRFGSIGEYLLTAQLVSIKEIWSQGFEFSLSITRLPTSLPEAFRLKGM
jgi:hypothetical protein